MHNSSRNKCHFHLKLARACMFKICAPRANIHIKSYYLVIISTVIMLKPNGASGCHLT